MELFELICRIVVTDFQSVVITSHIARKIPKTNLSSRIRVFYDKRSRAQYVTKLSYLVAFSQSYR